MRQMGRKQLRHDVVAGTVGWAWQLATLIEDP
jgi:hypothetical protein